MSKMKKISVSFVIAVLSFFNAAAVRADAIETLTCKASGLVDGITQVVVTTTRVAKQKYTPETIIVTIANGTTIHYSDTADDTLDSNSIIISSETDDSFFRLVTEIHKTKDGGYKIVKTKFTLDSSGVSFWGISEIAADTHVNCKFKSAR